MIKLNQFVWFMFFLISWTVLLWFEQFFGWPILSFIILVWLLQTQWRSLERLAGYFYSGLIIALSFNLGFFASGAVLLVMFLVNSIVDYLSKRSSNPLLVQLKNTKTFFSGFIGAVAIGFYSGANNYYYWLWWLLVLCVLLVWLVLKSYQIKLWQVK